MLRMNGHLSSMSRWIRIASILVFFGASRVGEEFVHAHKKARTEAAARTPRTAAKQDQKPNGGEIEILPVQGNVSMLAGAGGNITLQIGNDGILLVDTGSTSMSAKVVEAIESYSKKQVTLHH